MNATELSSTLDAFAAYRGARLESTSAEVREFVAIFGGARAEDVRDAIRAAAERDGRVFLETVARRHGEIRAERLQAAGRERDAAKRPPPTDSSRPGWPVAPGEPTTTYLAAIAAFGVRSRASAEKLAARYVGAGLVLPELADRIVGAMWPADRTLPASHRADAVRRVQDAIVHELGGWGRCPAEQFVAQFGRAA